jgi:hypothetical protein
MSAFEEIRAPAKHLMTPPDLRVTTSGTTPGNVGKHSPGLSILVSRLTPVSSDHLDASSFKQMEKR